MANPLASGTFTKAELSVLYQTKAAQGNGFSEPSPYAGSYVVIHPDDCYRVHFNPATDAVNVEVLMPDTITGMMTWFLASTYTAV